MPDQVDLSQRALAELRALVEKGALTQHVIVTPDGDRRMVRLATILALIDHVGALREALRELRSVCDDLMGDTDYDGDPRLKPMQKAGALLRRGET